MEVTGIPIVIGAPGTIPLSISKGTGRLGKRGRVETIIKVGQNTKKSPGDLSRFAVTQTPVKKHQLTLKG